MYNIIFIIVGFILDFVLSSFFHIDYSYQSMFFVPCFSFMAILLASKRMNIYHIIITGFILGFIQNMISGSVFYVYPIVYIISLMIYTFWSKNISDSLFETLLLLLTLLFVKEVLVYCMYHLLNVVSMSLMTFLVKRCFLTVVVGVFQGLIVMGLNHLTSSFIDSSNEYHNQNDNLFGHQFK